MANIARFFYESGNRENLTKEELDGIADVVMQIMPKKGLLNRATYLASKGVIPFKAISNRKSADGAAIKRAYRNAIGFDNTAFDEVCNNIIAIVNNSISVIEGDSPLAPENFTDEGEGYKKMLEGLNQLIYAKNLRWFLVITGNTPTEAQEKILADFAASKGDKEEEEE